MVQVIAVGNLKGGTGKTTISVNLAFRLARAGRSVVLLDADPQAAASAWIGRAEAVAADPRPVAVEMPLIEDERLERWTAGAAEVVEGHDVAVIDLPPQAGPALASVLMLSDLFLVPVTPSELDLRAAAKTLCIVNRLRSAERPDLACMLVPSKVDRRTHLGKRVKDMLLDLGWTVGPTLCQRSAHAEAFGAGQWIGGRSPGSDAHLEIEALVREVEAVLERVQRPGPAPGALAAPAARRTRDEVVTNTSGLQPWMVAQAKVSEARLLLRSWLGRIPVGRGDSRALGDPLARGARTDGSLSERAARMVRDTGARHKRESERATGIEPSAGARRKVAGHSDLQVPEPARPVFGRAPSRPEPPRQQDTPSCQKREDPPTHAKKRIAERAETAA